MQRKLSYKRLGKFNDEDKLELRRCAMRSGHTNYGRGGVAGFIDDLTYFLITERKDVIADFIENQAKA